MILKLDEMMYPAAFLPVLEEEFTDEVKIEIIEKKQLFYIVEIESGKPEIDIKLLTKIFLNRFLEIATERNYG